MKPATERPPSLPRAGAPIFRATVHGLAFANRSRLLTKVRAREELLLIPDPPDSSRQLVWVHLREGDPVGHLPVEIGCWLAPWMRGGGSARATVLKVGDESVPSWKRLLVEVTCAG